MTKRLKLTPFQRRSLAAAKDATLVFSLGGRGSGKTTLNIYAALQHADEYGEHARILIVRKSQNALAELEDEIEKTLIAAYGVNGFTRNRNMHEFRLTNGATIRCEPLDYITPATMARLVGQSISMLIVEEVGQYAEASVIDQLLSNLRAAAHVKCRAWFSANPGGPGAGWLRRRTIDQGAKPFELYVEKETGLKAVYSLSTHADNPMLAEGYGERLLASVATDPVLKAAWVEGSFDKVSGALFGDLWDSGVHIIEPWATLPRGAWDFRLGMDWGGVSPSVAELVAVARAEAAGSDDRRYPAGSAIVLGEVSSAIPPSVSQGDGCSPSEFATRIKEELLEPFGLRVRDLRVMAADSQINQRGAGRRSYTIGDEFKDNGLRFTSATKTNRPARLQQVRSLLDGSLKEGKPGLYVTRTAENLIVTVPTLLRSIHRPNDLDVRAPKHALDALSYALATTSRGSVTRQYGSGSARYSRQMRQLDEIEGIKV